MLVGYVEVKCAECVESITIFFIFRYLSKSKEKEEEKDDDEEERRNYLNILRMNVFLMLQSSARNGHHGDSYMV